MNKHINEIYGTLDIYQAKYNTCKTNNENGLMYYNVLISMVIQLILNKKIFKNNKECVEFLNSTLGFSFANYVTKNKTILIGQAIRRINNIEDLEIVKKHINNVYRFVEVVIEDEENKDKMDWHDIIKKMSLNRG